MSTSLTKAEIARRQLGLALALYLKNQDPVSVHTLACAGAEIAEGLSAIAGKPTYQSLRLEGMPEIKASDFRSLRNQYWNAFKHIEDRKGRPRADDELLASFSEDENTIRLFMGWFDFGVAGNPLPIAAQVFQAWFLALDPSKINTEHGKSLRNGLERHFPNLPNIGRHQQHRRLLRMIDRYKTDREFASDERTDQRPLILGALARS